MRATRSRREPIAILALLALLDLPAKYVLQHLGVGHAATAIVAAASAPYATVRSVGVSLFGEQPTRTQWLGVGLVVAGVILLGAVA